MRYKFGALALLILAMASHVSAQTFLLSEETLASGRSYLSCINEESLKLNLANEPIAETVELAKTACADHRQIIAAGVMRDVNAELTNTPATLRLDTAKQLRQTVEEQVTRAARLRLARHRSESAGSVK